MPGRFEHSRELPAPPESVFAAIRDPERLARWWGPDGFTNTFHTFEFRPGGSWHYTMQGPDARDYPNESEFLEIVPDALVRIRHVSLPLYELSVSLESVAGGTRISWVGTFENVGFAEKSRAFLEGANEQNLDRLAREVGTGETAASSSQVASCVPVIPSADLEKSLRFWVESLGLTMDRAMRQDGKLVGCMVHGEHVQFWLNRRTGSPTPPADYEGIRLYWTPRDLRALRGRLAGLGYAVSEIVDRDYGQTEFTVKDDDGYSHCFGVATERMSKPE